ncbi:hypothetical protein [Pedosphaera parvula]|uniref:Uncharacterized protein n=1 Tax=Pedosphaera parvula (strain Ellin514) TaxID=320771 RepID=B9XMM9_PEDPL|nr:hypothetical protein [Pedosphaera parvula]EEF58928.1 hypothetical protein Cflav_PD2930 [Pedosphaera parvula Ellin514]
MTFREWKTELGLSAKAQFGLELNDVGDEDRFKSAWEDGDTPLEYLDRVKEKYELIEAKEML